jgi:2-amino-4-hydroxy-6-hydroxymethyldihydropteridine diphosphokinase
VRASLADQARGAGAGRTASLAIALGANLPSPAGPPLATLVSVRPQLETLLTQFSPAGGPALHWSPLFRTAPVGGPTGQPDYLNAAVLVASTVPASLAVAQELLAELQALERHFGRQRRKHWGPRSLDLDLLWWGDLRCHTTALELPHPRLQERGFVLAPLAAIDAGLVPPGTQAPVATLLAQLAAASLEPAPQQLAGRLGWPEQPVRPKHAVQGQDWLLP